MGDTRGAAVQSTETGRNVRLEIDALADTLRAMARNEATIDPIGSLVASADALAAERDRADRAEALAENWRNDSREETEEHLVWKARAELAEMRLNKVLEYAESTYTASTVARRIVQMGKATA